MNKRIFPFILILIAAGVFIAFKSQGNNGDKEEPVTRYAKIMKNVGILLEEGHYSPKKIDDAFSKDVYKEYIEDLDGDKKIFLKSDMEILKKYQDKIDDEIHGAPLESFYAINEMYTKRQSELSTIYKEILAKPFDFTIKEELNLNPETTDYPTTDLERKNTWRQYLKWITLDKYIDLQNARTNAKAKDTIKTKTDYMLETEAREAIQARMDRYFTTSKNRETSDYNFGKFVNTITTTMDPHSNYFPPIDLRTFNESMRGNFFGIGAQLIEDDDGVKIASLVTGMPAWKSGEVKEGDIIIKVGQGKNMMVDVSGYDIQEAIKLIRGANGTVVTLGLRTIEGIEKTVSMVREKIELEATFARSAIVNGKNKVGYIYLPEFYADFDDPKGPRCAVDVAKEIVKLKEEKVDAIVMDLRGNGGGSLYDVVQMVGLFIDQGPICQVKARDTKPQVLSDRDRGTLWDGPLAVMVDETSASASEIFAAAIQDYQRGIVIGSSSTYGKGTVQRNIPLNPESNAGLFGSKEEPKEDLGTVKLTLQKFYRINGDATQQRGVVPDIILPDRLEYLKIREKDNPNALKYDKIEKADYSTWNTTYSANPVIAQANFQANADSTFSKIKREAMWLEKNMDKSYSLQIDEYKEDLKQRKEAVKKIGDLYKLDKKLNVTSLVSDKENIDKNKENKDRSAKFIEAIQSDIYIDQTVKVLDNLIVQANLAKGN